MPDEVEIRAMKSDDCFDVLRLMRQMSSYEPERSDWQGIADSFGAQDHVVGLVACAPQVIGFASISFEQKVRGGIFGHIEDVIVDAPFRGMGIGRALISGLLHESMRRGAYTVGLETQKGTTGFYESLGFVESGVSMRLDATSFPTSLGLEGR